MAHVDALGREDAGPEDARSVEARSVEDWAETFRRVREELKKLVVGQDTVFTQILASMLADGHCLLVGVPGLAKTLMIRSLAALLSLEFKRIQFTPDLMPSDITGTTIIGKDPEGDRDFHFLRGPVFANFILADEINRTPPKTQSALMEAMEERQVTAAGQRMRLRRPFFVMATQNPIEQEGTYPLPISQLDRFLMEVHVDYPTVDEEFLVVLRTTSGYHAELEPFLERDEILRALELVRGVEVSAPLMDYAARIVRSSRPGFEGTPDFVREWISWGAGPRAVQAILETSRALAFLDGRTRVTMDDIHQVAHPVLRHRLVLSYHAEAEGTDPDDLVEKILVHLGHYTPPAPEVSPRKKSFLSRLLTRR